MRRTLIAVALVVGSMFTATAAMAGVGTSPGVAETPGVGTSPGVAETPGVGTSPGVQEDLSGVVIQVVKP